MKTRSEVIEFITKAHDGQFDKQGVAYVHHPITVMWYFRYISCYFLFFLDQKNGDIAALLHDVIEDTEYTEEDLLKEGFSQETVDMVKILSCDLPENKHLSYQERIDKIIETGNTTAMAIKLADNLHNCHPNRRLNNYKKYLKSIDKLSKALGMTEESVNNLKDMVWGGINPEKT